MEKLKKIIFVSSYIPRECGIATYTDNLINAICEADSGVKCEVVAMNDGNRYEYPNRVKFSINQESDDDYIKVAHIINKSDANLVSLQHEFSIFGGFNGNKILKLLKHLKKPVVTTIHTVPFYSDAPYKIVSKRRKTRLKLLGKILKHSVRVTVMCEASKKFLDKEFGLPKNKILVIPHGGPSLTGSQLKLYREQKEKIGFCKDDFVLSTFGLIVPKKGLEYVVRALPAIIKANPSIKIKYLIAGRMHPRKTGEYLELLREMVKREGVVDNVFFDSRYLEFEEIYRYLANTNIYITPYYIKELASSGTLTYAISCGCCIVSTPYIHARDVLSRHKIGRLVAFRDSNSIAESVNELIKNPMKMQFFRDNAVSLGKELEWSNVGKIFIKLFQDAKSE